MDWKQILMPRPLRRSLKRARGFNNALAARVLNIALALELPIPLRRALRQRRTVARVVLYKQRIVSLVGTDRFLRYARGKGGLRKLQREYSAWQELRQNGLGGILVPEMRLLAAGDGQVLELPLLQEIGREEEISALLPILRALAKTARSVRHPAAPPTVAAGLNVVRRACGGTIPESFVVEGPFAKAFEQPLLTGYSHGDLHRRNIMRDAEGRPVLIDLKSCAADRVLALDILIFACKYMASRNRLSIIENAFALQRAGWAVPELEPVFELVDSPRAVWGPAVTLHALGQAALKKSDHKPIHPALAVLLRRSMARDWALGGDGAPDVSKTAIA
jgi:hypothetical protein